MNELLSPDEVRALVGCAARDAQCAKLSDLGVPFIRDGLRILVSREHLRQRILGVELRASAGVRLELVR